MYLIIALILIAITVVFTYNSKLAELRKKKPDFFNFGLTLVATFVGVLFAMELTNRAKFISEEETVVKILDATSIELTSNLEDALTYSEIIPILLQKAETSTDSTNYLKTFFNSNSLETSRLFENLIDNEMVLRHISSFGLQIYTSKCKDLTLLRRGIYMDDATNESILLGFGLYIPVLKFAQNIIIVEKAKIIEGIDEDEIKARYDRFSKEFSGIQVMDMEQLKEFIKNMKLE